MKATEVKFKAQREDNSKIVTGYYFSYTGDDEKTYHTILNESFFGLGHVTPIYIKPETLKIFTGLYDSTRWEDRSDEYQETSKKNWKGEPIYEGDLLLYLDLLRSDGVI